MSSGRPCYAAGVDSDDLVWAKLLLTLAVFPTLGLMWFFRSASTTLLDNLGFAVIAYLFGLFLAFIFLFLTLPVFVFLLDLWPTLIEDHRAVSARRRARAAEPPRPSQAPHGSIGERLPD